MPQISVIVPVYKVEQYLPACVESILAQSFSDFELILVDDGSPDNCGALCDAYAARDPRIRVIHQPNGGLSAARNAGIDAAIGAYITFIDSDDIVDERFLAALYQAAEQEDAGLVSSWFAPFPENAQPTSCPELLCPELIVRSGPEATLVLYQGNDSVTVNACGKLFRAGLIGETRFPVGKLHEDQAVIPLLCYRANRVVTFQTPLYHYRQRRQSITTGSFSLRRYDDITALDQCIAFFAERREAAIVQAAETKRKRLLCIYAIEAAHSGVDIPQEYQISSRNALRYLKKQVSDEKYEYCLNLVSPAGFRLYLFRKRVRHGLRKLFLRK